METAIQCVNFRGDELERYNRAKIFYDLWTQYPQQIEDFFPDFDQIKESYRSNNTLWTSQYPNRLLTPWDQPGPLNNIVKKYYKA